MSSAPAKTIQSARPMLSWQYRTMLGQIDQVNLHTSDDTCPCNQMDLDPPEYCIGKHLLSVSTLASETSQMDNPQRDMLEQLSSEALEYHEKAKTIYCKGGVWPDLEVWSRNWRKRLEPIYYACSVKQAKAPEPIQLHQAPPAPSPNKKLKTEVCRGLAFASKTHEGYLHLPPDPVTGSHKWHEGWIDLYGKALSVCGCQIQPPAPPQPFGGPGGKKQLAKTIVQMIPEHKTYVEPFCGAAAVFWKKEPSSVEVLSDMDADLIRFYRHIGDIKECKISQVSKDWQGLRARTGKLEGCEFLSQVMCSFGESRKSALLKSKPEEYNKYGGQYKVCGTNAPNFHKYLDDYKTRLKGVKLHKDDWEKVVRQYDARDTFIYFDPPYYGTSRAYNHAEDQLERLAQVLPKLKSKWLLSYDDHPAVRKAFKGFNIIGVCSHYTVLAGSNVKEGKQLLIVNYPIKRPPAPPEGQNLVMVKWDDAQIIRGVFKKKEAISHRLAVVETMGHLLLKDDEVTIVAAEHSDGDDYRDITIIPTVLVISVEKLKKSPAPPAGGREMGNNHNGHGEVNKTAIMLHHAYKYPPAPPRDITLVDPGSHGWHYGDRVKIKGGMAEFSGKTGTVIAAEGEYLRVKLDEPIMVKDVGLVKDDLWMPHTLTKLRAAAPPKRGSPKYISIQLPSRSWNIVLTRLGLAVTYYTKRGDKREAYNIKQLIKNVADQVVVAELSSNPAAPIALSPDEEAIPGFAPSLESCVLKLKGRKDIVSPYAVCRSSMRQKHGLPIKGG